MLFSDWVRSSLVNRQTTLASAVEDRVAAQWVALGGQLGGIDDRTPVDLEALIGMTADLGTLDPRVRGVAIDWCVEFGSVIHAGRLKKTAKEIGVTERALAVFGGQVAAAGGPRWPFAAVGIEATSRGKVVARDLVAPGRIMWRVRSAFGVNARSDILTVLLTTPPVPLTIADLARRTRFTKMNVAIAASGMSLSGVITKTRVGNEDRVALDRESPLRELLEPIGVPSIDWVARWGVAKRLSRLEQATSRGTPAVRVVETRSIAESLVPLLGAADLPRPDLTVVGPEWIDAYDEWVGAVTLRLGLMDA